MAAVIAPAQVHRHGHVRGPTENGSIDHVHVIPEQRLRVVAALTQLGLDGRVAHGGKHGIVQLHIAAPQPGQIGNFLPIRPGQIRPELLQIGIHPGVDAGTATKEMQRVWCRHGHLGD